MKLVWSPETATKAYIDTVKSCELSQDQSSIAEVVSAMAAGWNSKLIVETWSRGNEIATSVGLAIPTHHTGGRHICVVPDEESRSEYIEAMDQSGQSTSAYEIVAKEPEEAMEELQGIDFLVVDCRGIDFARIIRKAKLGQNGAVLICKNSSSDFNGLLDGGLRVVRRVVLPVGKGLGIAHVGAKGGRERRQRRWIKRIDQESGEEFVIRK